MVKPHGHHTALIRQYYSLMREIIIKNILNVFIFPRLKKPNTDSKEKKSCDDENANIQENVEKNNISKDYSVLKNEKGDNSTEETNFGDNKYEHNETNSNGTVVLAKENKAFVDSSEEDICEKSDHAAKKRISSDKSEILQSSNTEPNQLMYTTDDYDDVTEDPDKSCIATPYCDSLQSSVVNESIVDVPNSVEVMNIVKDETINEIPCYDDIQSKINTNRITKDDTIINSYDDVDSGMNSYDDVALKTQENEGDIKAEESKDMQKKTPITDALSPKRMGNENDRDVSLKETRPTSEESRPPVYAVPMKKKKNKINYPCSMIGNEVYESSELDSEKLLVTVDRDIQVMEELCKDGQEKMLMNLKFPRNSADIKDRETSTEITLNNEPQSGIEIVPEITISISDSSGTKDDPQTNKMNNHFRISETYEDYAEKSEEITANKVKHVKHDIAGNRLSNTDSQHSNYYEDMELFEINDNIDSEKEKERSSHLKQSIKTVTGLNLVTDEKTTHSIFKGTPEGIYEDENTYGVNKYEDCSTESKTYEDGNAYDDENTYEDDAEHNTYKDGAGNNTKEDDVKQNTYKDHEEHKKNELVTECNIDGDGAGNNTYEDEGTFADANAYTDDSRYSNIYEDDDINGDDINIKNGIEDDNTYAYDSTYSTKSKPNSLNLTTKTIQITNEHDEQENQQKIKDHKCENNSNDQRYEDNHNENTTDKKTIDAGAINSDTTKCYYSLEKSVDESGHGRYFPDKTIDDEYYEEMEMGDELVSISSLVNSDTPINNLSENEMCSVNQNNADSVQIEEEGIHTEKCTGSSTSGDHNEENTQEDDEDPYEAFTLRNEIDDDHDSDNVSIHL